MAAVGDELAAATMGALAGFWSTFSQLALASAKATDCGCSSWNCCALNGWPLTVACEYGRLSTTGLTELTTTGRKMNDSATVSRSTQPQRASPVPTRAGFFASTISV